MNDTQEAKGRATILQRHLQALGIVLPRGQALNVLAKMDGYRSHTAAKRGAPRSAERSKQSNLVLFGTQSCHQDVERCYVALGGGHCPYCGSHEVRDDNNASADETLWDFRVRCGACDQKWYATYRIDHRETYGIRKDSDEAVRKADCGCPSCGKDDDLQYGSVVMTGPLARQLAQCCLCTAQWVDVFALRELSTMED